MSCLKESTNLRPMEESIMSARSHPLYRIWWNMIARCETPHHHAYASYGGRGIKVCERWHDIENFAADVRQRPTGGTIDRIDNNGNYEPGNCRWASRGDQQRNTKRTMMLTVAGETMCQKDWTIRLRMGKATILRHVRRDGIEATQQWMATRSVPPKGTEHE